jgi:hypothetical protein
MPTGAIWPSGLPNGRDFSGVQQDFPGVPARRNTRHLAGEVGKAHAATLGTTTTHGIGKSTKRDKRKAAAGTAAVAALEGDTSGDVGPEEPLSEYEQQRLTRIA